MKTQIKLWLIPILMILLLPRPKAAAAAESPLVMGDILKKTESHYQELQGFTADFLQLTTSAATNTVTTEAAGTLFYQKPRQMRWEYKTPEPQVFIANHEIAWLHVPSEHQISLFDAETFFSSPLAQTFFDGIGGLKKHFEVSLDPAQSSATVAVLKLVPKKEDPNIQQLRLWIDLKTYEITKVETQDALANTNLIVLRSQKSAADLDDTLFQLEVPSSTSVMDAEGRQLPQGEVEKLKRKLSPKQEG